MSGKVTLLPFAPVNTILKNFESTGDLALFKHALVQDASYGTLLREPRRAALYCQTCDIRRPLTSASNQRPPRTVQFQVAQGLAALVRRLSSNNRCHNKRWCNRPASKPSSCPRNSLRNHSMATLRPSLVQSRRRDQRTRSVGQSGH
jgi:hypothetical protein